MNLKWNGTRICFRHTSIIRDPAYRNLVEWTYVEYKQKPYRLFSNLFLSIVFEIWRKWVFVCYKTFVFLSKVISTFNGCKPNCFCLTKTDCVFVQIQKCCWKPGLLYIRRRHFFEPGKNKCLTDHSYTCNVVSTFDNNAIYF